MVSVKAEGKGIWDKLKGKRPREALVLVVVILLVLLLVLFLGGKDNSGSTVAVQGTETEQKLASILREIDGVGEVQVMIGETEEGQKSVVIVCDGARSLQVIMDVREAAAAAVGTDENQIKIYVKGNK